MDGVRYEVWSAPRGKAHIARDGYALCGAGGYLTIGDDWVYHGTPWELLGVEEDWWWPSEKCRHCDREWGMV